MIFGPKLGQVELTPCKKWQLVGKKVQLEETYRGRAVVKGVGKGHREQP